MLANFIPKYNRNAYTLIQYELRFPSPYDTVPHCKNNKTQWVAVDVSTLGCEVKQLRSRDVLSAALASGLPFPPQGQSCHWEGVNAAACSAASACIWESEPYVGDWNQNFSRKQSQKTLSVLATLTASPTSAKHNPFSQFPGHYLGYLFYSLTLIVRFSFQLCTQRPCQDVLASLTS